MGAVREYNDTTALLNGRYRVLDSDGVVIYESFATPVEEESKALGAGDTEGGAWIDSDTAEQSGSTE